MSFLLFIKNLLTCQSCRKPKEIEHPEVIRTTIPRLSEDLYEFNDYYYGNIEISDI
ncbi:hypothetical protein CPAV1605_1118 [seawater metagenome]|uniref:Uncharacterized protein n=1 Tax=seawater metagenome TaxID=1561972 RepID=A0A5E8CJZ3_9ZZZZ